jgi:uncharacterized protein (DUF1778 family)
MISNCAEPGSIVRIEDVHDLGGIAMPRSVAESGRVEIRIDPEAKAKLARAAALEHIDLTAFILRAALPAAQIVIERAEHIELTERDSFKVLDLLENPPAANSRLRRAAASLVKSRLR